MCFITRNIRLFLRTKKRSKYKFISDFNFPFLLIFLLFLSAISQSQSSECPWDSIKREINPQILSNCVCAKNNQKNDQLSIQCNDIDGTQLIELLLSSAQEDLTHFPLELLYLNDSIISKENDGVLSNDFFQGVRMTSLQLSSCGIKEINPQAFQDLQNDLIHLSLTQNELDQIPKLAISNLENLQLLDLSLNKIDIVENGTFEDLTNLNTIKLNDNINLEIEYYAFSGLENSLRNLNLKACSLTTFPEALQNLSSLAFLDLAQNRLRSLENSKNSFKRMDSLTALNLERNLLQNLPEFVFEYINDTLTSLSLLNNLITHFPKKSLRHLNELKVLDLGFNLLTEIPIDGFKGLNSLTLMALDGNPIESLPVEAFSPLKESLRGLSLGGRFLNCDCRLKWIVNWIQNNDLQVTSRERSPQFCGQPSKLRELNFYNIQAEDLDCEKNKTSTTITITSTEISESSSSSSTPKLISLNENYGSRRRKHFKSSNSNSNPNRGSEKTSSQSQSEETNENEEEDEEENISSSSSIAVNKPINNVNSIPKEETSSSIASEEFKPSTYRPPIRFPFTPRPKWRQRTQSPIQKYSHPSISTTSTTTTSTSTSTTTPEPEILENYKKIDTYSESEYEHPKYYENNREKETTRNIEQRNINSNTQKKISFSGIAYDESKIPVITGVGPLGPGRGNVIPVKMPQTTPIPLPLPPPPSTTSSSNNLPSFIHSQSQPSIGSIRNSNLIFASSSTSSPLNIIEIRGIRRNKDKVIVSWESSQTTGFRIVYRYFGNEYFIQGPVISSIEREFSLHLDKEECAEVCIIPYEYEDIVFNEIDFNKSKIPSGSQCREVKSVASPFSSMLSMEKITIVSSAVICATVIFCLIVFIGVVKRKSKGNVLVKLPRESIIGSTLNLGQHQPNANALKEWDQISMVSSRSIPRARTNYDKNIMTTSSRHPQRSYLSHHHAVHNQSIQSYHCGMNNSTLGLNYLSNQSRLLRASMGSRNCQEKANRYLGPSSVVHRHYEQQQNKSNCNKKMAMGYNNTNNNHNSRKYHCSSMNEYEAPEQEINDSFLDNELDVYIARPSQRHDLVQL